MSTHADRHREFTACAERNARIMLRIARGFASDADRDDLLQEMLLALWHALPRFAGLSRESTFVYRVALNSALSWNRKRPQKTIDIDAIAEPHDDSGLPLDQLVKDEQSVALHATLRQLPPIDRSLILLHLDELSYQDISEVLGLSTSNVGARLSRARRRLGVLLQGELS